MKVCLLSFFNCGKITLQCKIKLVLFVNDNLHHFLNTANNRITQTQGQKVVSSYIQSLFVLTAPGQVLVSRDQDAPLSWVRHMEGLKCQVGLDAGTHAPEWVLRMWAAAPQHNLFFREGSGVPHLCYGVYVTL